MIQSLVPAMQAQWHRHEVLANNLANVSTAGFKRDDLMLTPVGAHPGPGASAVPGVAQIGPQALAQWTDFSQGPVRDTGRPLDVALDGSGLFVVQTPRGPRYTRAGAFSVSREGYLVTAGGFQVLGQGGPIAIRSPRVSVSAQGEVQDDGRTVDTLRVVDFRKPSGLMKEGDGLFVPADPTVAPGRAEGFQVVAGAIEESNVNPVRTMVEMIEMLRRYETAQRAIQAEDETNRYAANDMGRI
jgi:flagellar basal-body rod protein FlgG